MNHKFLIVGIPIIGGLLIAGLGIASAATIINNNHNMSAGRGSGGINYVSPTEWATNQTARFQAEATALGLPESVIVNGWASGQNLQQIATANGISSSQFQTDMKNYQQSQLKDRLQALVSQGTITQDQMNQYLQTIATRQANFANRVQNLSGTSKGHFNHKPIGM